MTDTQGERQAEMCFFNLICFEPAHPFAPSPRIEYIDSKWTGKFHKKVFLLKKFVENHYCRLICMEVIMNYVRRSSCALIFALACMANAHANLETIVQAVTAIPNDCFTSAIADKNHTAYMKADRDLNNALKTVAGQVLLARATNELSDNADGEVTIEKVQNAVEEKINTIINGDQSIKDDLQSISDDFIKTISAIKLLPQLDDDYDAVLAYLNQALTECVNEEKIFSNWPKLLKVAQKVSSEEDQKVLQAQRDLLKLTQSKINDVIIKEATQSEKTNPLYAAFDVAFNAEALIPFNAEDTEKKAVNNALKKIKKVNRKNILPVACEIAQCIRKSNSNKWQELIAPFIEKFTAISKSFQSTMLDNVSSLRKIKAIRSNVKNAKKELLLAARIVLFAGQDQEIDLNNFEEKITELKSTLQDLYSQSLDLEYSLEISSLNTSLIGSIKNYLLSFLPQREAEPVIEDGDDGDGDGEEEDVENAPIQYGEFETIAQALTDLNATQADKIVVLKALRAQAEAIFKQVKVADYEVDAQREFLSNAVNLMISKFKNCFANLENANAFINGQNKAAVKASTGAIKRNIADELVRNSINSASQAALDELATLLTEIYKTAAANAVA